LIRADLSRISPTIFESLGLRQASKEGVVLENDTPEQGKIRSSGYGFQIHLNEFSGGYVKDSANERYVDQDFDGGGGAGGLGIG